jgi:copper chaperone NosL
MDIQSQGKSRAGLTVVIAVLAVVGLAAVLVIQSQRPRTSLRTILWDREVCAQCGMTISDHRFACQLQTSAGDIYDFDDPGCLLTFLHRRHPRIRAIYFHALNASAWFKYPEVAFLPGQQTPMGYGLGAVAIGTSSALSFEAAQNHVVNRRRERPKAVEPLIQGAAQ